MANKEVMIVTPEEMQQMLVPSEKAMDAYRFALAHAGIEMDEGAEQEFVSQRNAKNEGFRELVEVQKWMEKTAASIKETLKHTYNVGTEEELPANVNWSKQSYTPKWSAEGAGVAVIKNLVEKGMITVDEVLCEVSVDALVRASGIEKNKLIMMYPEAIVEEPKKRTLSIK